MKLLCDYDSEIVKRPGDGENATLIQMKLILSKYNYVSWIFILKNYFLISLCRMNECQQSILVT